MRESIVFVSFERVSVSESESSSLDKPPTKRFWLVVLGIGVLVGLGVLMYNSSQSLDEKVHDSCVQEKRDIRNYGGELSDMCK
jgi:hypothetical protein